MEKCVTIPDIVPSTAEAVAPAVQSAGTGSATIDRPALRRRVMGLALPAIGENLLHTALGIADTILVAGIGVVALAGVGAALNVLFIVMAALSSLSVGASVLVAQAIGAGNSSRASHVAGQALLWGIVLSLPITLAGLIFATPVVALYGMAPDATAVAAEYLTISAASIPALALMLIGGSVLRGAGDSRTPMLVTALANVLNLIASWGLIYGHLGMPALGVAGSAWGTLIARVAGAALFLVILLRTSTRLRVGGPGTWRPRWRTAREVLWLGAPAALEEIIIITSFAALTPIVVGLGTVALAAHRVALNVLSLSFMPGIGFSLATTALVGQAVGAGRIDEARAVTKCGDALGDHLDGRVGGAVHPVCAADGRHIQRRPAVDRHWRCGSAGRRAGAAVVGGHIRYWRRATRHRRHPHTNGRLWYSGMGSGRHRAAARVCLARALGGMAGVHLYRSAGDRSVVAPVAS
jgi:MATE family multidrug resistance protein